MERKNLAGHKFNGRNETQYQVLAGHEGSEIVFIRLNGFDTDLNFSCDAYPFGNGMETSYNACYMVSKETFFSYIDTFSQTEKQNPDTIASALRRRYYKIPRVFLRLVGEAYLNEKC